MRVRIEAGMSEGRVVLFGIVPPAHLESLAGEPENLSGLSVNSAVIFGLWVVMIVSCLLAGRNTRQGRADRQGAGRLEPSGTTACSRRTA